MKNRSLILTAFIVLIFASSPVWAGYYDMGRSYYTYKKYDKAKEMFLKAAEKNDLGDAYYFLGEIEKLEGNYREAEEYYRTAISKKNITRQYLINSYWNIIVLVEQRDDYESVIKLCREMWQKTHEEGALHKIESLINKLLWTDNSDAIGMYNEGIELKKRGKAQEARKRFQESLGIDPSFLAPKFELGMIAYKNGDLDLAASYLNDIVARIPYYTDVHMILAEIYFSQHRYQAAIDHYLKIIEFGFIDDRAEYRVRVNLAICYYNINDFQDAETEIEKALTRHGKSVGPLLLLSTIKIRSGKYDEALKALHKAQSADPDNPEVLYQIGSIYYRQNDSRYASYFDRLFGLVSRKKEYQSKFSKVFIILAKYHFENKNYSRVIGILKALDEKSQGYETHLLAAKSCYYLKQYDESIDYFERISLGNEDKLMLCKAYALTGRREKAKSLLHELLYSEEYLAKAKQDPVLSALVKEIEREKTITGTNTEKMSVEKKPDDGEARSKSLHEKGQESGDEKK
jgi:tetratricopeptide (TPR) repeat protein